MKRLLLVSIIIISVKFNLFSQPVYKTGTVFLSNQDSIKGDLRYSFPWKPVLKENAFKYRSFEKAAVDSYEFSNGRSFQKFKLKYFDNSVEDVFAEVYLKGEITYVEHKKRQYLKIDSLDNLIRLTKKNYPGVFSLIMPSQQTLVEKGKSMKYTHRNVISLLQEFHQAEGRGYQNYESTKDKIHFAPSIQYGFSSIKLKLLQALQPVSNQENTTSNNRAYGIMTDITIPGLSKILFFKLGIERINNIQFDTNFRFGRDGTGFPDDRIFIPLSFSYDLTNLFFGLNFNVQARYISPYIGFGGIKPIISNQDSNYEPLFSLRRDILGYYVDGGVIIDLFPNIKPFVGFRYDNVTGSTNTGRIVNGLLSVNVQNLQANIGVKYLLKTNK